MCIYIYYDTLVIKQKINPYIENINGTCSILFEAEKRGRHFRYKFIELPTTQFEPILYYELIFKNYEYKEYYDSNIGSYRKFLCNKVYGIYLVVDIKKLNKYPYPKNNIYKLINRFMIKYYIGLNKKPNRWCNNSILTHKFELISFIKKSETEKLCITSNSAIKINNYVYHGNYFHPIENIQTSKINSLLQFAKRNGGFIETSRQKEVVKLIDGNNLIIMSKKNKNYWKKGVLIYYEKLNVDELLLFLLKDQIKVDKLILHDINKNYINKIIDLLNKLFIETVWIINSLPFNNYGFCPKNKNDGNLYFKELIYSIFGFHSPHNFIQESEIYDYHRVYIPNFIRDQENQLMNPIKSEESNRLYFLIDNLKLKCVKLNYSKFEIKTKEHINVHFNNWKNKLLPNTENIYSLIERDKMNELKYEINRIILFMSTVIKKKQDIIPFFGKNYLKKNELFPDLGFTKKKHFSINHDISIINVTSDLINAIIFHRETDNKIDIMVQVDDFDIMSNFLFQFLVDNGYVTDRKETNITSMIINFADITGTDYDFLYSLYANSDFYDFFQILLQYTPGAKILINPDNNDNLYQFLLKYISDEKIKVRKMDNDTKMLVKAIIKTGLNTTYLQKNLSDDTSQTCNICYSNYCDDNLIKVVNICGHIFCLECSLNSIAVSHECPLCKKHFSTDTLCILDETLDTENKENKKNIHTKSIDSSVFHSEVLLYFSNLDSKTIIICDSDLSYIKTQAKIININKDNHNFIKEKFKNKKLVFFINDPNNYFVQICNYFNCLKKRPEMKYVIIS